MKKIKPSIKRKSTASSKVSSAVSQISKVEKPEIVKPREIDIESLVPSPCVGFNLECSSKYQGSFQLGKVANLIGDSHAGKTLFALSIFAECALRERFANYRFIYDDVESANEFDIPYLFGEKTAGRIEEDVRSWTIEEFNDNISRSLDDPRPFIYVLDSFDALTSEAAIALDASNRIKREKGNKTDGSYGDGKPKIMSDFFKLHIQDLKHKDSLIIIISQTRDNLGFGASFNPKVRSGGKALKFYSSHEVWLAMKKKEKVGQRTLRTNVQAKITKNKITGRHGEAEFPILFDYGVDNILSMIQLLKKEKVWTGDGKAWNTHGFCSQKLGTRALIEYIEKRELEEEMAIICQEAYDNIIEKMRPTNRKRKYL